MYTKVYYKNTNDLQDNKEKIIIYCIPFVTTDKLYTELTLIHECFSQMYV